MTSVIHDTLVELDQISSQAESIAVDLRQSAESERINTVQNCAQLDTIICRLETAASLIRTLVPVT